MEISHIFTAKAELQAFPNAPVRYYEPYKNLCSWKSELYDITSSKRVFEAEWRTSGIPFYRAREIVKLAKQGYVNNKFYISKEMYEEYSKKYGKPKENDIMVTDVGTLGVCYVVRGNAIIN